MLGLVRTTCLYISWRHLRSRRMFRFKISILLKTGFPFWVCRHNKASTAHVHAFANQTSADVTEKLFCSQDGILTGKEVKHIKQLAVDLLSRIRINAVALVDAFDFRLDSFCFMLVVQLRCCSILSRWFCSRLCVPSVFSTLATEQKLAHASLQVVLYGRLSLLYEIRRLTRNSCAVVLQWWYLLKWLILCYCWTMSFVAKKEVYWSAWTTLGSWAVWVKLSYVRQYFKPGRSRIKRLHEMYSVPL